MDQARIGHEALPLARPSAASERELAFGAFVERALPLNYRLARAILGDPAEAEDATHDAFELAWKRWHTLRDPDLLDAWFGRIVVNVCRDRLRRRRRHPVMDLTTSTPWSRSRKVACCAKSRPAGPRNVPGRESQNSGIDGALGWAGSRAGSSPGNVPSNHGSSFQSGTGAAVPAVGTNGDRATSCWRWT